MFLVTFPDIAAMVAWWFIAWVTLIAFFGEFAFKSVREVRQRDRWEEILTEALRFRPYLPNLKSYFD